MAGNPTGSPSPAPIDTKPRMPQTPPILHSQLPVESVTNLTPNTLHVQSLEKELAAARLRVGTSRTAKLDVASKPSDITQKFLEDTIDCLDSKERDLMHATAFTPTPSPLSIPRPFGLKAGEPASPYERHCPCGACGDGHGDPNQDQVQCESCDRWSHRKCLSPDVDWDEAPFVCVGCSVKDVQTYEVR